jgi:thiamine biosynthesis lipoprotein
MGTIVRVHVIEPTPDSLASDSAEAHEAEAAIGRALDWFHEVEARCSRFDPESELRRLTSLAGVAVPVSAVLLEAVQFAVAIAEATDGAFDPAVGGSMEALGFTRDYRTGRDRPAGVATRGPVSYRDVALDRVARTITLRRPLLLDLGAVAKGLAVDLAARELRRFPGFAIDAGGDLYLGGRAPSGGAWSVGIRDPRDPDTLLDVVRVSDKAVCTSGGYERQTGAGRGHHILDPRTGRSVEVLASATVIAATAMVADGLATAAFVLGPEAGIGFLERQRVEGMVVSPDGAQRATAGFASMRAARTADVHV